MMMVGGTPQFLPELMNGVLGAFDRAIETLNNGGGWHNLTVGDRALLNIGSGMFSGGYKMIMVGGTPQFLAELMNGVLGAFDRAIETLNNGGGWHDLTVGDRALLNIGVAAGILSMNLPPFPPEMMN